MYGNHEQRLRIKQRFSSEHRSFIWLPKILTNTHHRKNCFNGGRKFLGLKELNKQEFEK
jgi:hypothetical protein